MLRLSDKRNVMYQMLKQQFAKRVESALIKNNKYIIFKNGTQIINLAHHLK